MALVFTGVVIMNCLRFIIVLAVILFLPLHGNAQLTTWFQWTFLPQAQLDEIIGEASGETAEDHTIALGGYNRDRKAAEYAGTFYEAQYVLDKMQEYGLLGATIERFPGSQTWDGITGELWEVSPVRQKLASFTDMRAMLATGSSNADVTAELVWVGDGSGKELAGLDVTGKIVVTSGSANSVHNVACLKYGAEGVISFNSPRPLFDPLIIPWSGLRGRRGSKTKFAFFLPPREGYRLRDRLKRGEKIVVHAQVEATMRNFELQDPTCYIPGTDPDAGEIIFTAHLFEGYAKQGANDNDSGCAAILETARVLNKLITDGRLPRPMRTIRFLWAPEFSGTIPWVNDNMDIMDKTLCNINLDMVGLQLTKSLAFMTLMRTSYGNPHYINDIMENAYRYIGETNRDYVINGFNDGMTRRIVAPSGSEEPFYWYMGTHFGASDHEVFNDWAIGVPGVVMNTWPDKWYHTSEDRADKIDPTQMKRVVIACAVAAYTIAQADDYSANQIAAEIVSNASNRLGHQLARGIEELRRSDVENFSAVYKKCRGYIEAAAINERLTVASVLELADNKNQFEKNIKLLQNSITSIEESHSAVLESFMRTTANRLGVDPAKVVLTDLEKKASKIVPRRTLKIRENGYRGYQQAISRIREESPGNSRIQRFRSESEIGLLVNGQNSILDIKKMIDTQYRDETGLQAIMDYLDILKKAGLVEW